MFACIEIDTDDVSMWKQIDSALAQILGLTHIIWGQSNGKNVPCQLPSTIYYTLSTEEPVKLLERIEELVKETWRGNLHVFVISDVNHWSNRKTVEKVHRVTIPSGEIDSVEREL